MMYDPPKNTLDNELDVQVSIPLGTDMYTSARKLLEFHGMDGHDIFLKNSSKEAEITLNKVGMIIGHWHKGFGDVWCYSSSDGVDFMVVEICDRVVKALGYPQVIGVYYAK